MTPGEKIRVLVVDDSAFARKVVREALARHPRLLVVGTARDGLEALERIAELKPDVITLDLVMPNLDGLGVLQALPAIGAPRVVVVSMSDATSELAVSALQRGAVDLVHKPTALATDQLFEMSDELCEKVVIAAGASPHRSVSGEAPPPVAFMPAPVGQVRLVVIGTSTGGPQALSRLIPSLPADLPVPVVVALHIPAGYTDSLARRLDDASAVDVIEARDTDVELRPGLVVIARGGTHLTLGRQRDSVVARLDHAHFGAVHTPSVDHLFKAAARELGARVLGVVLTGMGNDGLEGSRAIRESGGTVLVESAASCVVYGMPRAVREAGLAAGESTLDQMASRIVAHL